MKKKGEKGSAPQDEKKLAADSEVSKKKQPEENENGQPAEKAANAGQAKVESNAENKVDAENPKDAAEKTAGEGSTQDDKKQVSETDILKIYLNQAVSELKRTREDCEEKKKQLDSLNGKTAQLEKNFNSLTAEYENYRRRTAGEKEAIYADAVAKAVLALLPALDSLERAMQYAESNPESFREGVKMTLKQLSDGFKSLNVEEIDADGTQFDPELHNAVMHAEDENSGESVVAEVFQKGYKIGEKVIRHSMVKVVN